MSIGIDFILRANTSSFTAGMAKVNNSVKDFKKELHEFGGGRLGHAIGILGVVEAFKSAIESARKLRDEEVRLGKPVDDATRSVAEYGDSLASVGKGLSDFGASVLSIFTRAGEAYGMMINSMMGKSDEVAEMGKRIEEQAIAAEARLAGARKKFAEENTDEKKEQAADRLRKATDDLAVATGHHSQEQTALNEAVDDQARLQEKLAHAKAGTERDNARAALLEKEADILKKQLALTESIAKKSGELNLAREEWGKAIADQDELRKKHQSGRRDPYLKSVDELAAQETGGFTPQNDPRLVARRIKQTEAQAQNAFNQQNFKLGDSLTDKAEKMRESLSGKAKSSDTDREDAYKKALSGSETKLAEISSKLDGLLKARP